MNLDGIYESHNPDQAEVSRHEGRGLSDLVEVSYAADYCYRNKQAIEKLIQSAA
jgi:hypothetical protein